MSDFDLVLGGTVVLPSHVIAPGYVAVSGGRIARVGAGEAPAARERHVLPLDAYILPGAIDGQTHCRSTKGVEDFDTATRAAAAGGVTTIVDMPYDQGRLICTAERFGLKAREAQQLTHVDLALYATAHPNDGARHIDALVEAGASAFKFSTFGTDPERFPRIPPQMLHECFARIARHGLMAGVHNENEEVIRACEARVRAEGLRGPRVHGLARPIYSETLAITEIYEIGAATGCRAHVVHCSTGRGYELCAAYRALGHPTTIEACLHYLILTEEDLERIGGLGKVNPPVRAAVERERLWSHLAAGNITIVSTDHVSWPLERKSNPDMLANASGVPGLEVLYPLFVKECLARGLSLSCAARVLAHNPASLFCLDHCKGALAVGMDADITVLVPGSHAYDPQASGFNAVSWSPYAGMQIPHRVQATYLRGELIFDGTKVRAVPGTGRFLRPQRLAEPRAGTAR
ncbi:MAG TPA: amidohydrolase family protein [Steroidobacteraceae bacterium]|nr:amidohydrolase family protein [Steroidobacteraceae bacterium]